MKILFVCTGNICRSPLAERLAAVYAAERQITDLRASSAGIRAVVGKSMHHDAVDVLENLGGDASGFAARQLTPRLATDTDLILTMTAAHRDMVLELAPQKLHRTFTMGEAARAATEFDIQNIADLARLRSHVAGEESDVPDPIGQDHEFFVTIGSMIAALLAPVLALCQKGLLP